MQGHSLNKMQPQSMYTPLNYQPVLNLRNFVSCSSSSLDDAAAVTTAATTKSNRKSSSPLPPPPNLQGKAPRKYWNAAALAFLGDSVWEVRSYNYYFLLCLSINQSFIHFLFLQLYVRRRFFHPPTRVSEYYATVVQHVRAEAQADLYRSLEAGSFLTADERDVLRWGRNAAGTTPKRVSQGGMNKETYRLATAIECLVSESNPLCPSVCDEQIINFSLTRSFSFISHRLDIYI